MQRRTHLHRRLHKEGKMNQMHCEIDEQLYRLTNQSLFGFLQETVDCSEDTAAFHYYRKSFTYGMLRRRVYEIADKLRELGIAAGDRILISLITTPDSVALLYASNLIGAVPILADVRLTATELYSLICETEVKIAVLSDFNVSDPRLLASAPKLKRLIIASPCDGLSFPVRLVRKLYVTFAGNSFLFFRRKHPRLFLWNELFGKAGDRSPEPGDRPSDGGELIFTTSGTTGARKYVRISAFALNLAAYRFSLNMDLSQIKSVLSIMPIFTCYGFLNSVHAPLAFQKEMFLYPIIRFGAFPKMLLKTKASATFGVLGQWESMLSSRRLSKADLSFLTFASWGGDGCPREKLKAINDFLAGHGCTVKLCQGYGMTETVSAATVQMPDQYIPGSAGKPLPFVRICITEIGTDRTLPPGALGEICVHSPCQTSGYDRDDAATEHLLHIHDDDLIWVHSGDLGYMDQEGNLFVEGRMKRMIVTENGTKVFLSRLEETVKNHPQTDDCAAFTVPRQKSEGGSSLILYVVPKPGVNKKAYKRSLRSLIRRTLPDYLHPDWIICVKRVLKTALGKNAYRELATMWNGLNSKVPIE